MQSAKSELGAQGPQAADWEANAAARKAVELAEPLIPVATNPGCEPEPLLPSQHEQQSISLSAARIEKLRCEREKRRSPAERRREFLAPLAAG